MIKIGVCGACGKMGSEVIKAISKEQEMNLVCAVDKNKAGVEIQSGIKVETDLKNILKYQPDVVVDFTDPESVYKNVSFYLENKIKSVIGTTGLNFNQIEEIKAKSESQNVGCLIIPNFSIGAVLMMLFAQKASAYFSHAEIIEMHHNQKKDAPSGTALKTAQMMAQQRESFILGNGQEKETISGARGAKSASDIQIHSIRLPGFTASQEVILSESGELLTLRHDSHNRLCYHKGIIMGIDYVFKNNTFVYGLEHIL